MQHAEFSWRGSTFGAFHVKDFSLRTYVLFVTSIALFADGREDVRVPINAGAFGGFRIRDWQKESQLAIFGCIFTAQRATATPC
jgi:hypothetical protein